MKKIIFTIITASIITILMIPTGKGESIAVSSTQPVPVMQIESKPQTEPAVTKAITPEIAIKNLSTIPTSRALFTRYYPNEDYDKTLDAGARVLAGEASKVYKYSKTNCAAVIECICNRADKGIRGNTFYECATARHQFTGYRKHSKIQPHLRALAEEVMYNWLLEKAGYGSSWRVLPSNEYIYSRGDGKYNHFRIVYEFYKHPHEETPK